MMQEDQGKFPIVAFYSRPGCHICEVALTGLKEIERVVDMHLIEYNIDEDDILNEEFGIVIPVIKINGKIVQYGNINMAEVRRILLREDSE